MSANDGTAHEHEPQQTTVNGHEQGSPQEGEGEREESGGKWDRVEMKEQRGERAEGSKSE
jgi:hypothetical protein